ncbi:hypothetical protein [Micromonospora sp. NPDC023956]|uniref:hypothetical protein n=1 Tax=Micromonospora sp. NPDC023956 TaxID=3155722 RepID=UPI0033E92054
MTLVVAALTMVGADLPDDVRWSVLFGALGLLVLRTAAATWTSGASDRVLLDRAAFLTDPINERLRLAREVLVFAPTGENLLNRERCEVLRSGPLSRQDGSVRVVVLGGSGTEDSAHVVRQLDELLEIPVQQAADSLRETHQRLASMARWQVPGSFAYRTISVSPGFSIVSVDPSRRDGFVIVEFHGFRSDTIASRMHLRLVRGQDDPWYDYWLEQFHAIWEAADSRQGSDRSG